MKQSVGLHRNYILFPSCLGQETAKGPFGLQIKLPPAYHTQRRLHAVSLIAERQAKKLKIPISTVFGPTQPGIEHEFTVSVADALSTRPLISQISMSEVYRLIIL